MAGSGTARKIALGADHAGFELKQRLQRYLEQTKGFEVVDCGTHSPDPVDYPAIAAAVAQRVAVGECGRGIMIDGAGIGSAMAANKIPGVRAAMCYDVSTARNSREHNDANVLTLGAGMIGRSLAEQIVDAWLSWDCTAERHRRRVALINALDTAGAANSAPNPSAVSSEAPSASAGPGAASHAASAAATCACGAGGSSAPTAAISDDDLARIVARVTELSGAAAAAASGACHDPLCSVCKVCADIDPQSARRLVEAGADRIGHRPGQPPLPAELAKYIDHTLLRPEATVDDVRRLCGEAREYGFASVCVNPPYVALCAKELAGTDVKVCAVVGFPLGAHVPEIKAMEARRAIRDGAREIDMVINVGALRSGLCDLVLRDIRAVTDACIERGVVSKVILETASLNDDEKVTACQLARRARADFVKTSTGFGAGGATAHDVSLMAEAVRGTRIGVKASGGIRNFEQAQQMIAAGATRLGVSAGVKIVQESRGAAAPAGAAGAAPGAGNY